MDPRLFDSDLRYLKEKGYQAVFVQDLIHYVQEGTPLPRKPIMITFDDGYYNNYVYAFPSAKKYGMKIIISPIGYYTDVFSQKDADHANYSHLTWNEINEMIESGLVEFQNHTYNLHACRGRLGVQKLKQESSARYQALLKTDLERMQEEMQANTGYTPAAFVYPYGAISRESILVLKAMGFQASLTCESRPNLITRDPDCLFGLGRYLRPSGTSSASFFHRIGVE